MSELKKEMSKVRIKNASLGTEVDVLKERLIMVEQFTNKNNIEVVEFQKLTMKMLFR